MIGNITQGKDFIGLLRYLLHEREGATILESNLGSDSIRSMAREFESISLRKPSVQRRVKHISLAFAPEDGKVDPDIKIEIAQTLLQRLGYDNNQVLIVSHSREEAGHEHDHIHIVTNAIKLDGTRVRDSFEWRRTEAILRDLERDYELTSVISSWEKDRSNPTRGQVERIKREAADPTKTAPQKPVSALVQDAIALAVSQTSTMSDFIAHVQHQGVNVLPRITREKIIQGISYELDGVTFPGSKLRGCSFPKIQERGIEYLADRDLPNLIRVSQGEKIPQKSTEKDEEKYQTFSPIGEDNIFVIANAAIAILNFLEQREYREEKYYLSASPTHVYVATIYNEPIIDLTLDNENWSLRQPAQITPKIIEDFRSTHQWVLAQEKTKKMNQQRYTPTPIRRR